MIGSGACSLSMFVAMLGAIHSGLTVFVVIDVFA